MQMDFVVWESWYRTIVFLTTFLHLFFEKYRMKDSTMSFKRQLPLGESVGFI